uniref:Transposase n=1 Tax=Heterorhabditis bacteriophora TaxID=37862 RepID=A0A1I7WW85_HETBA
MAITKYKKTRNDKAGIVTGIPLFRPRQLPLDHDGALNDSQCDDDEVTGY